MGDDDDDGAVQEHLAPLMSSNLYAQQRYLYVSSERIIPYLREDSDVSLPVKMGIVVICTCGEVAHQTPNTPVQL